MKHEFIKKNLKQASDEHYIPFSALVLLNFIYDVN